MDCEGKDDALCYLEAILRSKYILMADTGCEMQRFWGHLVACRDQGCSQAYCAECKLLIQHRVRCLKSSCAQCEHILNIAPHTLYLYHTSKDALAVLQLSKKDADERAAAVALIDLVKLT